MTEPTITEFQDSTDGQQWWFTKLEASFDCCGVHTKYFHRGTQPASAYLPGEKLPEDVLRAWWGSRLKLHQCNLVTQDNPLGRKDWADAK